MCIFKFEAFLKFNCYLAKIKYTYIAERFKLELVSTKKVIRMMIVYFYFRSRSSIRHACAGNTSRVCTTRCELDLEISAAYQGD